MPLACSQMANLLAYVMFLAKTVCKSVFLQVVLTGTPSTLVLLPSALQLHQLLVSQALQAVLNILLPAACALSLGQQTQLCNL